MNVRTRPTTRRQLEALQARLEVIAAREDYGQWIHCFSGDTTPETVEQQALLAEARQLIGARAAL